MSFLTIKKKKEILGTSQTSFATKDVNLYTYTYTYIYIHIYIYIYIYNFFKAVIIIMCDFFQVIKKTFFCYAKYIYIYTYIFVISVGISVYLPQYVSKMR